MKKINVIGTSGSGKSTFAKALSRKLRYPYIEIDAIFWGKNWFWPKDEVFFDRLKNELDQEHWVLDGNYTRTTDIKWKDVDTVIWIDYSFSRTLFQVISRSISRAISQEELWPETGNRQTISNLFSKDSIIMWALKNYKKNKVKYLKTMNNPQYRHIRFIQLKNPKACQAFLNGISPNLNPGQ